MRHRTALLSSGVRIKNYARFWLVIVALIPIVLLWSNGFPAPAQEPVASDQAQAVEPPQYPPKLTAPQKKRILDRLHEQVAALKKQAELLQQNQKQLRSQVRSQCGLSPENVSPILLGLERDRFALEIEAKLKSAQRESLARSIAKETVVSRDREDADGILEQLEKIIGARQHLLSTQQRLRESNAVSEVEVKNAEAGLAEAQIRLALRKQELRKSQSSAAIDRLTQQLSEVSLEVAQDELRLELLKDRLDTLGAVQNVLDAYKIISESELPRVLRLLERTQTQLTEFELSP